MLTYVTKRKRKRVRPSAVKVAGVGGGGGRIVAVATFDPLKRGGSAQTKESAFSSKREAFNFLPESGVLKVFSPQIVPIVGLPSKSMGEKLGGGDQVFK